MLQSIPNPVYLFQGIVLRRGAKGTGMKSIELALSMCDIVDIYGFTVDPGYTEWSAQFRFSYCHYHVYHQLKTCLFPWYLHRYLNLLLLFLAISFYSGYFDFFKHIRIS